MRWIKLMVWRDALRRVEGQIAACAMRDRRWWHLLGAASDIRAQISNLSKLTTDGERS